MSDNTLKPLRPLQTKAMTMLRQSLQTGHRRPVLALPTGAGKTVIAAHIVHGILGKFHRLAFAVPLIGLIDQTVERFVENGISLGDIGVMQGNHPLRRPAAPIQVCSIPTLASRGFPEVDAVIVDEAHIQFEVIKAWMDANPRKIFIGLSATPWARGMGNQWDDLLVPTSVSELIQEGWLVPFRCFAAPKPDLAGVQRVGDDYNATQLSDRMRSPRLVADMVQTWLDKADGRPTLAFCVDCAHAQAVTKQFEDVGVRAAYVDADTPREERRRFQRLSESGEISVIVSIGTMTHGVDMPHISCISFGRPTLSEILYVQSIGRGLRIAPGKADYLLILDHSQSTANLGSVLDISFDRLRPALGVGERRDRPAEDRLKPKECPKCSFFVPVGTYECPFCGFTPQRRSKVMTVEGELLELGATQSKEAKTTKNANAHWTPESKARFYGELKAFAFERSHKDGWAAHKYKEKFGVWPNDPRIKYAPMVTVSPHTRSWIRSRQIAFAKGRQTHQQTISHQHSEMQS